MKRLFSILLSILTIVTLTEAVIPSASADTEKLIIYNWEDYITPDWEKDFITYYKNLTGKDIEIIYTTFDTNETMITKIKTGAAEVDVACPSEYAIQRLYEDNLLLKLDWSDTSLYKNVNNVDSQIIETIDSTFKVADGKFSDYMMPYFWGTLGILYNPEFVTEDDLAKGWGLLWNENNNPALNGKILMKDSIRDTYAAAVLYLKEYDKLPKGYENKSTAELINCTDDIMLSAAEAVLKEQKSIIKGYEVDFGKDDMLQKTAYVDLAWSGDAIYAIECGAEEGVTLDYLIPEIGANIWYDGWVIPTTCKNQTAAQIFIDYMNTPSVAAANMMEVGYSSAVDKELIKADSAAIAVIEENDYDIDEFFSYKPRYPEITDKLGVMEDYGERNDACVAMWERVKSEGNSTLMIAVGVVVAAAVVIVIIFAAVKVTSGKKRRRKV